jgi:hypothetical protein
LNPWQSNGLTKAGKTLEKNLLGRVFLEIQRQHPKIHSGKEPISKQSEFIFYKDSDGGCGGSPLLKLSQQNGSGVNPRQGSRLTTVGLHNGLLGKDSYVLAFNTFESMQEMIFQLVELMGINDLMPEGSY